MPADGNQGPVLWTGFFVANFTELVITIFSSVCFSVFICQLGTANSAAKKLRWI